MHGTQLMLQPTPQAPRTAQSRHSAQRPAT
jgi:hypothetical protein